MGAFSIDAKDAGSSLTTEKGVTVIQGVLIEMLSRTPVNKTFQCLGRQNTVSCKKLFTLSVLFSALVPTFATNSRGDACYVVRLQVVSIRVYSVEV